MKKNLFLLIFCSIHCFLMAQFAPPACQPGSTAIAKDDIRITAWATACTIERGWLNIADTSLGHATVGNTNAALGMALSNGVISLGDKGSITCSFLSGIVNGPGYDFAVFENSFQEDFLELAFVEVSSDGIHFVRFPSTSYTQDTIQKDTFGLIDARSINNLAGKYKAGFGTPFDLEELEDSINIDLNDIVHVKLIDVCGSVNVDYASYDQFGHIINDPWPTPFPSSGFDLDAIAVLNAKYGLGIHESDAPHSWTAYPNPFKESITMRGADMNLFELLNSFGQVISTFNASESINTSTLTKGLYLLHNKQDNTYMKVIKE